MSNETPILLDRMKEKLKSLLKYLKDERALTAADVSLDMGYKKNYISEMLSPKGTVTEKFMNAFQNKYRDVLENRTPVSKPQMSDDARLLRVEAILEVLIIQQAMTKAKNKEDFPQQFSELQRLIEEAYRRRAGA